MAASQGRSHTLNGYSGGPPTPNLRWHYFRRLLSRRKRKHRRGGGGRKSLSRFSVPLNHKNRRRAGVSEPRPGRLSRRWRCAVMGKWRGPGLPPPRPSLSGSGTPGGLRATEKGVSEYVVLALRALLVRHPTFYSAIQSLPWVSVSSTKWEVCPDFEPLPQHIPWASHIQRC